MVRFTMLAVVVSVAAGASAARGQDADEVKRLKERIELLETKLKLAGREIQDLKKENEQLRAVGAKGASKPAVADGFGVGTKLTGTMTRRWLANGKQVVAGDGVEFEVTKRSGKEFTAEFWADNRKAGFEFAGTIDGNVVKFKSTKSLTDTTAKVVGLHDFTGRLEKGVLTGRTTKQGDPTYSGTWKLTTHKD